MRTLVAFTVIAFLCTAAAPPKVRDAQPKQVTDDLHQDGYAEWSPDGKSIVYTSVRDDEERLWRVPAEGGKPFRVTPYRSHHARFSPGGDYIAFDGEAGSLVQVMATSGGAAVRIVPESIPLENSSYPCWSPDGTRIAFHSQYDLMIVDLPTGKLSKVFNREGRRPIPVHWSKKSDCILASLYNRESRNGDLWRIPLGSGEPQQLTRFGDVLHARVSPDESLIVFSSRTSGNADLWVMLWGGGQPLQLTTDPSHEFEASWSPKGDRLAFTRVTGRQWDIWTMEIDRKQIKKELKALNKG